MADLISHMLLAQLVKRSTPLPGSLYSFVVGTALPDLLGRMPRVVIQKLDTVFAFTAPPILLDVWGVLHTPIPFIIVCALIAFAFEERHRVSIFLNLSLGGLLHFAVDFSQIHIGGDAYKLFFPFSFQGYELGWLGTEASLWLLPVLLPLSLWVEWRYQKRKVQGEGV